jgi:hypothetical protein
MEQEQMNRTHVNERFRNFFLLNITTLVSKCSITLAPKCMDVVRPNRDYDRIIMK